MYGLKFQKIRKEDYRFGGSTQILESMSMPSANWSSYIPKFESQAGLYFDTWACVSFSAANVIETKLTRLYKNNLLHKTDKEWLEKKGYVENCEINLSDRFIAKMSGTQVGVGNTGQDVGQAIREHGLVPESAWPFPNAQRTPIFTDRDYYSEIPEDIKALGKEFLEHFGIMYEVVYRNDWDDALRYSPLQIFVYAWKEKNDIYYSPAFKKQNHAVMKFSTENTIYDHYQPEMKTLEEDFNYYQYGFKYSLTYQLATNMRLVKLANEKTVYFIDEKGYRRAFYDAQHFAKVAPILGLAKNGTDFSQVQTIEKEEMENLKLGRPLFLSQ